MKSLFKKKFWKNEFAKNHLLCRLIPLDKAHPNIPKESDYRPIVVTSPIIKILEQLLLIFYKLCEEFVNINQVGFMRGRSTMDNIV